MSRTAIVSTLTRSLLAGSSRSIARVATPSRATIIAAPARSLSTTLPHFASSTTPHSTISDPAVLESQKALEEGTGHLESGNLEGAKAAYLRSIEINESSSAHFNLAVVQFQLKDFDASIQSFEKSLQLNKDSPDAHTNIASAYIMSTPRDRDLATEHLKKAAVLDPTDGEIWFNLGAVLEACEQLEESLEAYASARDAGVERADQNHRNVAAKILAAKATAPEHLKEVAASEKEKSSSSS